MYEPFVSLSTASRASPLIYYVMSSRGRARSGRFFPVQGYVGFCGLCVCVVWAGVTVVLNTFMNEEHVAARRQQEPSGSNCKMLEVTSAAVALADTKYFQETLKKILIPRVVGSPGHTKVKKFIIEELQSLGWSVISDISHQDTPNFGKLKFENIIAKINPSAKQYVVLACHYDSKYFGEERFVGATDSAVPCAMLLNLAHTLQKELKALQGTDLGLELWFFDGEEAFVYWGPKDSLYGSRHLAKKLEKQNALSQIKCLILLDLLGTQKPRMYNYYGETELFAYFVASEKALRSGGHMKEGFSQENMFFVNKKVEHPVEDDHTPFLQRKVPIIHWIPEQFPEVWHTMQDDIDVIDMDTVEDMNKILRLFVLRYFRLC